MALYGIHMHQARVSRCCFLLSQSNSQVSSRNIGSDSKESQNKGGVFFTAWK